MNTDQWIEGLVRDLQPVRQSVGERRLALALTCGGLAALILMGWAYGPRADWHDAIALPAYWAKVLLPLAIASAGIPWVFRLVHPGMPEGAARWWSLVPIMALGVWATCVWFAADPAQRPALLWGQTWRACVPNILVSALPVMIALMWAARGLAPTQPARTGAAVGWSAGGLGAAIYALHCTEMAAPFLFVWYGLGMVLSAVVGAMAGAKLLRW